MFCQLYYLFYIKNSTEEFQDFLRTKQKRKIWPLLELRAAFGRKYNINIGCFDGAKMNPRNITERNIASKIHNIHFCLFWKSNDNSFNQAIKGLKLHFDLIVSGTSDKHGNSFIKYEYKPTKVQSPLTNIILYDLETYIKDRAIPYCSCIYKLSKISDEYNQDISEDEYQKRLKDSIVFRGSGCINEMLDFIFQYKGEGKKVINKIVEYIRYLIAHNGSSFDIYLVLNNLPDWQTVGNLIKNGAGIVFLKMFNGCADRVKKSTPVCPFQMRKSSFQ